MSPEQFQQLRLVLESEAGAAISPVTPLSQPRVVFVMEEDHSKPDLIDDNVAIGKILVREAAVSLVAVEGGGGGHAFDVNTRVYLDTKHPSSLTPNDLRNPSSPKCISDRRRFALGMVIVPGVSLIGIDSPELCTQMTDDVEAGRFDPRQIASHPNQEARSRHMILSLVEKLQAKPDITAAILNAGQRHIEDIVSGRVCSITEMATANALSLIRVRSRLFPNT